MAPLKILIAGGGLAGPALALLLLTHPDPKRYRITILERNPTLRTGGAQIDLRAQGIEVVRRLALLETVRKHVVDEAGAQMVDDQYRIWGTFLANTSGQGAQTGTSEWEIMRGDLVRVLADAVREQEGKVASAEEIVAWRFGTSISQFTDTGAKVDVQFSDGSADTYDMLIGADGQGSRVRGAILPSDEDPVVRTGVNMAYWIVPRTEYDNNLRKIYHLPQRRLLMSRTHCDTETQAYFATYDMGAEARSIPRASVGKQKAYWYEKFKDAAWETHRFLRGMEETENFYCQEVIQIHASRWTKGRVACLGDAAHCPSPISGMGTSSAFVGAWVLAGEIGKIEVRKETKEGAVEAALQKYEKTLRPFVSEIQKINPRFVRLIYPETWWGVWILRMIGFLMSVTNIVNIMARFKSEERGGWKLPEYQQGIHHR